MGNIFVIIAFVAYALVILGIGIFSYKKSKSMNDYFIGGRQLGSWTTAISAQASDMSGWLLMGLPGAIFVSGLTESWIAIGLFIGTYLNWKILAARLGVRCPTPPATPSLSRSTSRSASSRRIPLYASRARQLFSCSSLSTPLPHSAAAPSCSTTCSARITRFPLPSARSSSFPTPSSADSSRSAGLTSFRVC